VLSLLQQVFPTEQANLKDSSSDTAFDAGRVYCCHSCSFNMAVGCTSLIKRSLVYHAYEKLKKDKSQNCKTNVFEGVGFPSALYQKAYFTI
jgi:hypothetical protein